MHTVYLLMLLFLTIQLKAQPGYRNQVYNFSVHKSHPNIKMLWRSNNTDWKLAEKKDSTFCTESILKEPQDKIDLKLYKANSRDTMFIATDKSLHHIEFVPGSFDLTKAAGYLYNLIAIGDTKISNKLWLNVQASHSNLPSLQKTRQAYFKKSHYPFEMDEADVLYSSFQPSDHIKTSGNEDYEDWLTLGKIYHNPKESTSYYTLAYYTEVEEAPSDNEYYWLLESNDGLRSWKKKFPLKHNVLELLDFTNGVFSFASYQSKDEMVKYNTNGNPIATIATTSEYCTLPENKFYNCDTHLYPFADGSKTISSPMMQADNMQHIFHSYFVVDNKSIHLTGLPFKPSQIQCHDIVSNELFSVVELHTNETYVYLTQRKNKLVLLSYHYTMVSNDFGKT